MYYYIVNPASGGSKIGKIQERLTDRLKRLGIMGEFVKTTGPDDVSKLTRLGIERGYKTIVAVGGDGTINEVLNSILKFGNEKIALGIIPTGTTNDLADSLGIKDWYAAASVLANRKIEEINLGRVQNRYFVTSVAVGFEPKIAHLKRLSKGNVPEKIRFSLSMFKQAASYKSIDVILRFDNNYEVEAECFNVLVSSGIFSPVKLKNSEGPSFLDTVVITKIPGSKALRYAKVSGFTGIDWPKVSIFHSKKVEIDAKKPADVTADGQLVGTTPVTIRLSEEKIRVIVARKRGLKNSLRNG